MSYVKLIQAEHIPNYWPNIESRVVAACLYNGGRYSSEDCLQELLSKQKQLWLANDSEGVIITQIIDFPQMRCCSIDICTGENLAEWGDLVSVIECWARNQECSQMFLIARPGMEKLLKQHGYLKTHSVFEKELRELH